MEKSICIICDKERWILGNKLCDFCFIKQQVKDNVEISKMVESQTKVIDYASTKSESRTQAFPEGPFGDSSGIRIGVPR